MMSLPVQKGRLGRGLASLIGEVPSAEQRLPAHGEQRLVSIDQLHPSAFNPRKNFDETELAELANSIHSGLIAKLNLAYALDTVGFSAGDGSDGYYTTINNASWDFNSVAIQPGVGYVIGATIAQNDQTDFMLGRFRFDGKIDTLWTSQSTAFHPFDFGLNGQFDLLADVKVQGDGIYAVGTGFKTPTNTDFVAAKLTLDRIFRDRFE